jgi:hypothetical protein
MCGTPAPGLLDAGTLRPGTELVARRVDYLLASESFYPGPGGAEGIPRRRRPRRKRPRGRGRGGPSRRRAGDSRPPSTLRCLGRFTRGDAAASGKRARSPYPTACMPAYAATPRTPPPPEISSTALSLRPLTESSSDRALLWAPPRRPLRQESGGRASIRAWKRERDYRTGLGFHRGMNVSVAKLWKKCSLAYCGTNRPPARPLPDGG